MSSNQSPPIEVRPHPVHWTVYLVLWVVMSAFLVGAVEEAQNGKTKTSDVSTQIKADVHQKCRP